ncbi:origin of replication complex subunit 6-like [Coffea arabica]|uniref:Origin of replication complex subunit 6-like n=1 Tax=Coffea arabica TaxID=13443 RepID=A0A6P6V6L3_COFAR|nr:origin of replication complex subunit 6-like [Coffea arabica]
MPFPSEPHFSLSQIFQSLKPNLQKKKTMDLSEIAKKLGLSQPKHLIRKAAELRRLADAQFDSSIIGVGEICKAIMCLEIAASRMDVIFDRQAAIRLSGMSERAYIRSFNSMQNGIGVKNNVDVRELAVQFGCVRLIPFVHKGLSLYKDRFLSSLPPSRRGTADFTRPVFTAVAFYLCAKKYKLNVDKMKLIEICGTSESEFSSVSISMRDLCFDEFGVSKEKKDPREIKGNRALLDALPEKRTVEDGGYLSDDGGEPSAYKKRKRKDRHDYEEWKSAVLGCNGRTKAKAPARSAKQAKLNFFKKAVETQV